MPAAQRRLEIVTGKGGVGKTTIAVAMAKAARSRGQRVLLCEASGHDSLSHSLGCEPVGYKMREVQEGLFAVDIRPLDAMREYIQLTLRFEPLVKVLMNNPIAKSLLRTIPGLGDLVTLGKLWYHCQPRNPPDVDLVIFDAPASGHMSSMLKTPRTVRQAVPAGPLQKNARDLDAMLTDANTALQIVTLLEEMPVTEANQLQSLAATLRIRTHPCIINRHLQPPPTGDAPVPSTSPWRRALQAHECIQRRQSIELKGLNAKLRGGAVFADDPNPPSQPALCALIAEQWATRFGP